MKNCRIGGRGRVGGFLRRGRGNSAIFRGIRGERGGRERRDW